MMICSKMILGIGSLILLTLISPSCGKTSQDASTAKESPKKIPNITPSGPTVECPVCGLQFRQSESAATAAHEGQIYYFFMEDHKNEFKLNPDSYLQKDLNENETKRPGTVEKGE